VANLPEAREELRAGLAATARAVDTRLEEYLPTPEGLAGDIGKAVRHSLTGGKRVRPFVVRLAAETFGLDAERVTPAACAFELLHTATLIHDDLPAIDDADLRRGQASCHAAFGEPTAILAGDALIVAAFDALAAQAEEPATPAEAVARVLREFAQAVQTVVRGEAVDIQAEAEPPSAELLDFIHRHKTAALFVGAARAGALLAGAPEEGLQALTDHAQAAGLLFQVTDDLLDVEGTTEELGKPAGADARAGKQTYPAVYGVEETRRRAEALAEEARAAAGRLPAKQAVWLALVQLILERRS